jgi:drug/metabolite transporter (DMT)-like permease
MAATGREWALFFLCVVFWGSAYGMTRTAMDAGSTPALIASARLWIAAGFLFALLQWMRRQGNAPGPTLGASRKLALLGLVGGAFPFFLLAWAQNFIPSGLVGIIAALTPVMVAAFAWIVAPEDRLTPAKVIGVSLGFVGVAVLMAPDAQAPLGDRAVWGVMAAVTAAIAYAVNTLLVRVGPVIPPLEASAGWTFFGALWSTPLGAYDLMHNPGPSPLGWTMITALALGPTALAGIAYFRLIESPGPTFATQTNYVLPIWAVGLGAFLLGERLNANAFWALLLVASGLFIAQEGWRHWRRR